METSIREFYIETDGRRIFSKLYQPLAQGRLPLVIFSHGLGADNMNFEGYARAVAPLGYACLCFDFCGGGFNSKSSGKTTDMTPLTEVSDLEAVLNEALQWDFVDAKKVFLVGESLGGLVSALTAGRNSDLVSGIFLIFPAFVIRDKARRFKSPDRIPGIIELPDWITLGRQYYIDSWNIDVDGAIESFNKPVRIIHGREDELVPFESSLSAAGKYADCELRLIDGVGHELNNPVLAEPALSFLKEFLSEV